MSTIKPMHTNLVLVLALIIFILGILGFMDMKNYTYLGYQTSNFKVTKVDENSPASESGMMVGDEILSINGTDARDGKARDDEPRKMVGDTLDLGIQRNGEEMSYSLVYASQPAKDRMNNRLGWLIGLIFLGMAVWAFISNKTWAALMFAMFGLGLGSSFLGGPYIENDTVSGIVNSVRFSFVLLSFAFLVSFLLNFPNRDAFLDKKNAKYIIFGPAVFLSLFFIGLNIFDPDSTSGLVKTVDILFLLFIVFYFGWALLKMISRFRSASADERSQTGVGMMFWGTVIGLLPILIIVILDYLAPTLSLPGEDYYYMTMVLIPISFALAINKNSGTDSSEG